MEKKKDEGRKKRKKRKRKKKKERKEEEEERKTEGRKKEEERKEEGRRKEEEELLNKHCLRALFVVQQLSPQRMYPCLLDKLKPVTKFRLSMRHCSLASP